MTNDAEGKSSPSTEVPAGKSGSPHPGEELKRLIVLSSVVLFAVILWLIPPPSGVQPRAWHLLAIFVATIVGIITKPFPMGAIALFGNCGNGAFRDAHHQPGSEWFWEQHHLGDQLAGIDSATTALVGLSVLLIANVLTWKDILREEGAWDTLVWFAALVMMASFLNELGLIPWFTKSAQGMVGGVNWGVAFLVLCLLYFYSHYFLPAKLRMSVPCTRRSSPYP